MNLFTPILTPAGRLNIVTDDMPLGHVRDIPNMQLYVQPKDVNDRSSIIAIPYRLIGVGRRRDVMEKAVRLLLPLVQAQMEEKAFIDEYGDCRLVTFGGEPNARQALERAILDSMSGPSNIFYQTHGIGKERTYSNRLVMAVTNGVNICTYTEPEDYEKILSAPYKPNEMVGTLSVFGRESYCLLSHNFFHLRRFSGDAWKKTVEERLNEIFPFLVPTGMFHSLKF